MPRGERSTSFFGSLSSFLQVIFETGFMSKHLAKGAFKWFPLIFHSNQDFAFGELSLYFSPCFQFKLLHPIFLCIHFHAHCLDLHHKVTSLETSTNYPLFPPILLHMLWDTSHHFHQFLLLPAIDLSTALSNGMHQG